MDYNEIIVDGPHWTDHLPTTIEAFFGGGELAASQHASFLRTYGLTNEEVPLLLFDDHNWEAPFSLRNW